MAMLSSVGGQLWSWMPMPMATTVHRGATSSHRVRFLEYSRRRNAAGSPSAASAHARSGASTLVDGTSEYIQPARTMAKATGPCSVNSQFCQLSGSRNQHPAISSPLTATTTGIS